ncbi:zinc finger protein 417-like [Toxorhynchites rutilus septentrionalis]|uniref:zinc finger protein 417-like n=1 Tax=Toxorhynchites rutilus septentrionalis TaxID=329112 RepID=UPI002479D4F2|nr:zinc finger protein 417-like [Toxorhynchites rutilus septentrionalis]
MNIIADVVPENYTIIKEDISSVCRCCLASEELTEIFQNGLEISAELVEFISVYIEVDQNDGLPNYVCSACVSSLRKWHQFRLKCSESYQLLERLKECGVETLEETEEICVDSELIVHGVKIEQVYLGREAICIDKEHDSLNEDDQMIDSITEEERFETMHGLLDTKRPNKKDNGEKINNRKGIKEDAKKRYNYLRQCPICGIVMKRGLKEHIMVHNDPTGRPFKCDSCDKTYCRKENLRQHREREHLLIRYPCDVCGKVFSTKDILSVHRKLHNADVQYKCDQCDQVFNSNKYLYKHKQKHRGIKKFVCSFCGKSFLVGEYLKDHLRIHTGERPFECKLCGKGFRTANHLRQHNRTHQTTVSDTRDKNDQPEC